MQKLSNICMSFLCKNISQVWSLCVFYLFIYSKKKTKKTLFTISPDFDECQLWYWKCQEAPPADPSRHPITPLKRIKCYIRTPHLLSDHIVRLLEWQALYVCVGVWWAAPVAGRAFAVCHINPLMRVTSFCVVLRPTAPWRSEWHWGQRASQLLCHLRALVKSGHPRPVRFVTERHPQEPALPWGQELRGTWVEGVWGGIKKCPTDSP